MSLYDLLKGMDRRTFLRIISFTGIGGLIYPHNLISSLISTTSSRVVIVEDKTATYSTLINQNTVQVMMDSGIKALAQKNDIGEAWKTLLPNINFSSNIAIKVNCINSSLRSHREVAYAVIEGLKQMVCGGSAFPENNIIIFDRTNNELQQCGYTLNTSSTGVRCFGTNSSGVHYSTQTFDVHRKNQRLSKIITDMSDYLINISVLKRLSISGVSLCLKNNYGTCDRPDELHANDCDPYIPALNALSPILSKQKVNICDALFGGTDGPPEFVINKIIVSQDIVTTDYWGREILRDKYHNNISLAHHIETAATDYSLGTNDPFQMGVVTITDPTTGIDSIDKNQIKPDSFLLQRNYPNPFNRQTQIRFYISRPVEVKLMIFDSAGKCVRRLISKTLNNGWHEVTWDGYNDFRKQVASGFYLCQLKTNVFQKAIIMQLVK